jgi:hypothetical protein
MDNTKKLIKNIQGSFNLPKLTPIATDMYVPNHSGSHDAGIILNTPTKDTSIVNKKYVDDSISAIPAPDLSGLVPYTGATAAVDLGANNLTIDTTTFFVDSTNNIIGVGTSNPIYKLRIAGTGQTTAALTDAGNKGSSLYLHSTDGLSGSGGALLFGAPTTTGVTPQAAIKSLLLNGSTNGTGHLAFSTRGSSADTALTERMRIISTGRVGIGTTTITKGQLGINGAIVSHVGTEPTNGMASGLGVKQSADSILSGILLESSANTNNGGLYHNGTGLMIREGAVDTACFDGGNVGIGTTSPGEKLEVNGNIQLTADNNLLKFGTGEDASITYNGTNMVIDPKVVGTGILDISGRLQTDGYNAVDGTAGLAGTKVYYVSDSSGGAVNRKLTFKDGLLVAET